MSVLTLCIVVFFCRIIDVSMATCRTVMTVKGKTKIASTIAFFETLLWFLVIKEALDYETANFLETLYIALAYAGGFSLGTFVGGEIAKRIASNIEVQVVTSSKNDELIKKLQEEGYALTVTSSKATQFSGEKYLLFSVIKNTKLEDFKDLVYSLDSNAFITVSETKYLYHGFVK